MFSLCVAILYYAWMAPDCVGTWRELQCLLFWSRACERRVNRLLTFLWALRGQLTRQLLCLTVVGGVPWRWQCSHKPLLCDHQCHFSFSGYGTDSVDIFFAWVFIKTTDRSHNASCILFLSYCKRMTILFISEEIITMGTRWKTKRHSGRI